MSNVEENSISIPRFVLADEDIYEAMKKIQGYLDITLNDFKEVYALAYEHALERLTHQVSAADIMTRPVVTVSPEAPLAEVAEIMGKHGVSGVPVVDGEGRVLGVISEKDFLVRLGVEGSKNFMSLVAACLKVRKCLAVPMREKTAADIMTAPAVTVATDAPLKDIARVLFSKGINRVPVTDSAGFLQGIVTRGDIIRASTEGVEA